MPLRVWTASALLVTLLVIGGCGSSGTPSSPSSQGPAVITILGQNGTQAFSPNPSTFAGQTVVFTNRDSVPHQVMLNDGSVNTGMIAPGASSNAVTMPAAGTNYHCSLHPGMIGSVGSTNTPAPACTGDYCTGY